MYRSEHLCELIDVTDKITNRIKELEALLQKAQETHQKALHTLQACERDMIALDASINELNNLKNE